MDNDKLFEGITSSKESAIEHSIMRAALDHLNARDADTALGHYLPGATVISNGKKFESFEMFENDVRDFYQSLKEVKLAVWENVQIKILSSSIALFTASVRWQSVDKSGSTLKLKGIWSSVFLLDQDIWKILHRHESFEPDDKTD